MFIELGQLLRFRDKRKLIQSVSKVFDHHFFYNPDVGPIHQFLTTDCFIVSIPKCGTSALQRGMERLGRSVIHAHTNSSTFSAFPNGEILRDHDIGMENLLKARIAANPKPVHVFFGYRDPLTWYLSLAGQFSLPLDAHLRDSFIPNWESGYPWRNYQIDEIARIIQEGTRVRILGHRFDTQSGITVIRKNNVRLVLYRYDRLKCAAKFIQENIDPAFELRNERVNQDDSYSTYRSNFRLPDSILVRLVKNRWFQHFYSDHEQREWKRKWATD